MFLAAIQLEAGSSLELTDENPLEYRFKLVSRESKEAKHHLEQMKNLNLGTEFCERYINPLFEEIQSRL